MFEANANSYWGLFGGNSLVLPGFWYGLCVDQSLNFTWSGFILSFEMPSGMHCGYACS